MLKLLPLIFETFILLILLVNEFITDKTPVDALIVEAFIVELLIVFIDALVPNITLDVV